MATQDQELVRAFGHADETMRVARMRGYELPDGWAEAKAVAAAAEAVLRGQEPPGTAALPAAKAVAGYCDKLAAARAAWRGRVEVAREVHDRAQREAARLGLAAAPAVAARLVDQANNTLLPRFVELLGTAPRTLTGHESAEGLTQHAELLKAGEELGAAALDRASLAIATGESADLGHSGPGWLFVDPNPGASVFDVAAAIERAARGGVPVSVDDWSKLVHVGVRFAAEGEAAHRLEQFTRARAIAATGPDGGMRDRTYSELLQPASVAG